MQDGARGARRSAWGRFVSTAVLAMLAVPAFAAPPYKYYVLAPEQLSADLSVMSLEPGNTVSIGLKQLALAQYARGTIAAADLTPGKVISGTALYTLGSNGDATDLLAPDFFAGTSFIIPHVAGSHRYYVQATNTTANLTIQIGASTDTLQVNPGVAYEIDGGSDNGIAGRITSDEPIVVVHVADVSGAPRDAYPVPPAATELVGIRSQSVVLGANTDGTSATVYTSDGASTTYALNAGEKASVTVGANGAQGAGAAVRIVSNHPIAAVQYDDGDGQDATSFWPSSAFARKHGIPVNAQYVAVACLQSGSVTLFKGSSAPETQTCSVSGNDPGKVYFGSATNGSNVSAGWHLHSTVPVYVLYEASAIEDEHNLSGAQQVAGPSAPTLAAVTASTTSNPLAISGTAGASLAVRLYINGVHQQTTTASGGGAFAFNAELYDGNNVLHVVAVSATGEESSPSNVEQVSYTNTIPRTQSGSLAGNQVWTPGNPATPYVISATLTIASGAKLVLQPGTTLRFANGTTLTANGTLKIAGTAGNPVTLTSNAGSPTRGIWGGVTLATGSGGSEISHAVVEWATTSIYANNVPATIRNTTIRNFSNDGIYVGGSGASGTLIEGNLIDNLNDQVDCIEVSNSSPTISGNTITNCGNGLYFNGASSPTVNANLITSNVTGLYTYGGYGTNLAPVVTGNQLFNNSSWNYYACCFAPNAAATVKLNAKQNWWGSTDPTTIAAKINDLTDSYTDQYMPTVDYSEYLDGPAGTPVPGNYLSGVLSATSTTLTAGTTYQMLGVLVIGTGKTLTIPAGAVLRFHASAFLLVDGTLIAQGVSGTPVTFTSGRPTPARGDWRGVYVRAGSGTLIEYAHLEWATTTVNFTSVVATLRNSTIRNFSNDGVYITGTAASGSLLQQNLFDNLNDQADCVEVAGSSPTITGNTITNCGNGLYFNGASSPTVNANLITSNVTGLYTYGGYGTSLAPVVTGNQFTNNSSWNYYACCFAPNAAATVKLNATGNWWGTTDTTAIAAKINDFTDGYTDQYMPTVDYSGYLDGPAGAPVAGNQLIGPLSASTTLTAGTTYEVLGVLAVGTGKTLTIPAGAVLRFHANSFLLVDGTLAISGTSGNVATLTSGRPTPARGDWRGVYVRAGSGTLIEYAHLEWATTTVNITGVVGTVRNSTIRNFSNDGIYISGTGASGSLIESNLIDNLNDQVDCIEVSNSSPTITDNTITNCGNGLYFNGASSPTVNANLITSNVTGLYTYGGYGTNLAPVVTGNQFTNNSSWNYYACCFASNAAATVKLNAKQNWWGSTDPTTIAAKINDLTDGYTDQYMPTVDYSEYLDGPTGAPVPGNYLIGPFSAASTTLTAGTTYQVLGVLTIGTGKSLTIPAGVVLRFHASAFVMVDGTLTVQGVSGTLVTFTSGRPTPARGDWRGVYVRAGSGTLIEYANLEWATTTVNFTSVAATLRNSTIRNFSNDGVYVSGAGASGSLLQQNLIDNLNDQVDCIEVTSSSPTITDNTITNCGNGLYFNGASSPTVNANLITSNVTGLYTYGGYGTNLAPVVTGNQFTNNSSWNYYACCFASNAAATVKLNATGNWWGSTDTTAIAAKINDFTDGYTDQYMPTVDYSGYLDGPNGSPVPGNQLIGPLSASTTLTAGTTYEVLGVLAIGTGKTLTVPAGAVLRFHANSFLLVDGTLAISGSSGNLVTLTSGRATPARGDWRGVYVRAGSATLIEYAHLEWASTAVNFTGVAATIRNSTIRNFSNDGIYVSGAGASGSLIEGNLIDNLNDQVDCIEVTSSSPTISGNTITNCSTGLYFNGASSPTVNANNVITSNLNGIYAYGGYGTNLSPVVTGNQIFNNSNWNYYTCCFAPNAAATVKLNAKQNWWGTTDATTIAAKINDLTDGYTDQYMPTVDYSEYLDGPAGTPVPGNYLIGPLSATSTTLTAGATYQVLGVLFVGTGKTLTIPAGTVLRFHSSAFLVVDGTLSVQGTTANRVRFTSGHAAPARGSWYGVLVRSASTGTLIDYALIEWVNRGVDVQSTNATIRNSIVRNFLTAGISMTSAGTSSQIQNNYIDNFNKTGDGIYLNTSSPQITGNRVHRSNTGIYMTGASNPSVTGNIFTENNYGIYLWGNWNSAATAVPRPTITGNDIFNNTNAQLEVSAYGAGNPAVITATGNWWGTATPTAGAQIKFTNGSPTTTVNFSSPATGPLNGTTSGTIAVTEAYFSPNGDSIKETTTVQGTLSASSSWTVTIRAVGGGTVRTFTGSGTSVSAVWDGQNGSSALQPDGVYDCEVSVAASPDPVIVGFCTTTLDTTSPASTITSPAASSTLQNVVQVQVSGNAADVQLFDYTLEYGVGSSPTSWTTIQSQTTGVINGLLGTWTVSSTVGSVGLPNGPYTLRLRVSDRAGNVGTTTNPVTLDNISITTVTQNLELIRPLLSEQLQVGFTMSAPGTAHLRIYPEQGGALVKDVAQVFTTAGAKTISWDGRNTAGAYVNDEAYSYTLFIEDGIRQALYDPPDPGDVGSGSGSVDTGYNATRNDFWKMDYWLDTMKGRVRMQVNGCGITGTHMVYDWVPFLPGTNLLMWDGRDQNGNLVSGTCNIYFDPPNPLKAASVIVKGVKPSITGSGVAPNIEVKSNPYRATHSYEQVSRITYRVNQDSYVTVKLLPPGISDPANPQAIVLVNNVLQNATSSGSPIDHVVQWDGFDDVDTNNVLVSSEGAYTFTIQATGAVSGASSLYRGALQLYQ